MTARSFLDSIEPDGGTDLVEAVRRALALAPHSNDRPLRVIYIGDGTPSVGAISAQRLVQEIGRVFPPGRGSLNAVAVGADSDMQALSAIARGGGGVVIPYVPGERASAVALRVLGASYGMALRSPVVELPDGLVDAYPRTVDNIPAGGESFVVARMTRALVQGTIKLHGRVGGDAYDQSFPVTLSASSSKGNAFVPRLYAAVKIADLEANQGAGAKSEIVDLSKKFAVASRFTSLLVLESPAMFRAFRVDQSRPELPLWTGDEEGDSSAVDGLRQFAANDDGIMPGFGGGSGVASSAPKKDKASAVAGPANPFDAEESYAAPPPAADQPRPRARPSQMACSPGDLACSMPGESRRMIPMRRVWD